MDWLEFRDVWSVPYIGRIREAAPGLVWIGSMFQPDSDTGEIRVALEGKITAKQARAIADTLEEADRAYAAALG